LAMIAVIVLDERQSIGAITTTSDFAPTVYSRPSYRKFIPDPLVLRNGNQLRDWLISILGQCDQSQTSLAN